MEVFPIELLLEIFDYIPEDIINLSQVCQYFNEIARTQIKNITISFERESEDEILAISKILKDFQSVKLKLKLAYDVNIAEKADLLVLHSNTIAHLTLSEFSFLNPFFDQHNVVVYNKLETLEILNSDLTSSSQELSNFILKSCVSLKNLKIQHCSGLEIEALNEIGRNLSQTKIQKLELHPTYSYFDIMSQNSDDGWKIDNLRTLSIRSKLVVMKKNFVRNMLSISNQRKFPNLKKLELIAELSCGSNFITTLMQKFPNLESLSIGKGVDVCNNDFVKICNFYTNLHSLEYHFVQKDEQLELKHRLLKNYAIKDLTIGIMKNITHEHLEKISKSLPNLKKLNLIIYYLIPSNQDFIKKIAEIFPHIKELNFNHIGQFESLHVLF